MLDPNLGIWALLFYTYVMYGLGYVLGFAWTADEENKPGLIVVFLSVLLWPFFKGLNDGTEL